MYIEDGSHIDYCEESYERPCIYSWGWIGNTIPKSEYTFDNEATAKIVKKLKGFVTEGRDKVTSHHMGHHTCEICGEDDYYFNGTVRIAYKGMIYCSPAGVHHYIEKHGYIPPKEALLALKKGNVLSEEAWNRHNKRDKDYQAHLEERRLAYIKEREERERKEEEWKEQREKQAQAKLDRINKSPNPKDAFAKRLIDLFLIDS